MHMNRNNNRSRSSSSISNSNNNNNKSSNKSKIFSLNISRGISPHLPGGGGGRRGRSSTPKSRRRVAAASASANNNNEDDEDDDGSYVSGEHSIEGGIDKSHNNTTSTARGRFARYLNSKLSYRHHNDDGRDSGRRDIRGHSNNNKRAPSLPRQKIGGKFATTKAIW